MANQRKPRSNADLKTASERVGYEVAMLRYMAEYLFDPKIQQLGQANPPLQNALVHSFLLPTRTLYEFLYKGQRKQGRMIAEDFFASDQGWHNARPEKHPVWKENRLAADVSQRLAHLSWARVTLPKRDWPIAEIVRALAAALDAFTTKTPAATIDMSLTGEVRALKRLVGQLACASAHGG